MKTPNPFAPCHPDPFCPHPIHFKQNVHMLSIEGYMPNVLSHCPTNTISNTDHPLLNFILQYFIVKPHLFFDSNITIQPPKTVNRYCSPYVHLAASNGIAQKKGSIWLVSGTRIFRTSINNKKIFQVILLAPITVLPHPTLHTPAPIRYKHNDEYDLNWLISPNATI